MRKRFDTALESLSSEKERLSGILLAVSGGVDSMVMLSLAASSPLAGRIGAAHMNFSLRGAESDGDEALVRDWCAERGIPLFVKRVDTAAYAREHGVSIEMAARELRYAWFEELLGKEGFGCVAVAHNRNDSAETLILNLLRGTGLRGISGIRPRNGRIIRPMLGFSRSEIEDYARGNGIPYRTDSTNLESEYSRNRIRNEVFPEFEKINPSFLKSLSADMARFAEAGDYLTRKLAEEEPRFVRRTSLECGALLEIDSAALASDPFRALRLFTLLEPYGFNSAQLEQLEAVIDGSAGKVFSVPGYRLVSGSGKWTLYEDVSDPSDLASRVSVTVIPRPEGFNPANPPAGTLYADASKLTFPLTFRRWQEGDSFRPLGMKGFRKVSDFFNDLKLDIEQKRRQIIVATKDSAGAEQIVCIANRRLDDRFKVTEATDRIAVISLTE